MMRRMADYSRLLFLKKIKMKIYISPEMEVVVVAVEQGFGASNSGENGGNGMNTPSMGGF